MQRNNRLSVSAGASHRAWRFSQSLNRPASEPGDPQSQGDLGSDDDWQLTMGSDSDVEDQDIPAPLSEDPPEPDHPEDDHLDIHWNRDEEENYIDDVKQGNVPPANIVPVSLSSPPPSHSKPAVFSPDHPDHKLVSAFDQNLKVSHPTADHLERAQQVSTPPRPDDRPEPSSPLRDEYDIDMYDQPPIIPGFRGVTSRAALAAELTPPLPESNPRSSAWADRPRGTNAYSMSVVQQTDAASRASSPGARLNRAESDSALSSQGGSIGSGLRMSTRTSSEASDTSRRTATKSVSFVTQGVDSVKTSPKKRSPDPIGVVPVPMPPTSAPSSGRSSGSLKMAERRVSGLRMSIRDGRARLSHGRLSVTKRQQRRSASIDMSSGNEAESDLTANTSAHSPEIVTPGGMRSLPMRIVNGSSSSMPGSEHRLSARSDAPYQRVESELSQNAVRPLGPSLHASSTNFDNPPSSSRSGGVFPVRRQHGEVFPTYTTSSSTASTPPRKKGNQPVLTPTTKDLSFLECVFGILKGCNILKRKNFMNAAEAQIWLHSGMKKVQYRMTKKGNPPTIIDLPLDRVKKLKGNERDLSFELIDEKKSIDFIFPSRARADMWLSGLCCLVPSHASVKSRNRKLELRVNYDPLVDSWNGKLLSSRKRLNEFILLGSIGRGSFGKVKLALSSEDREFYAVKVLSKAMMRKRIRSVPLDKGLRELRGPGQLTVADVNEIVVMKDLVHENVMKMKGVFDDEEEDRIYIVVELLANGPIMSSSKLTGAHPISEDRARSAFVDVLMGLEYLHHNNIVHRDIKPDNLLEAGDGIVKISDFGAAVLYKGGERNPTDSLQLSNSTVGTPAFTAPELCMSDKSPPCPTRCFSADIWSLGASLFYMVYGRAPFIARSVFEMYDAICSQNILFPDTPVVSKNLQALIRQLLEKDPEKRATISSIIRSPWLTDNVEIADNLSKLREAMMLHSTGVREQTQERRSGLATKPLAEGSGIRNRVGSKLSS